MIQVTLTLERELKTMIKQLLAQTPVIPRHRYLRRHRKPLKEWFMPANDSMLNIPTGDDPKLDEALKANAEQRDA